MVHKKAFFIVAVCLAVVVAVAASSVSADENIGSKNLENALSNVEKHISKLFEVKDKISDDDLKSGRAGTSVLINPSGSARVTNGEIISIAAPNFTLKVWGHDYFVMTDSQLTKFVGSNNEVAFSDLKVGHKVDVKGEMMTESGHEGHIKTQLVRDRTLVSDERAQRIEELKKKIQELIERLQKLLSGTGGGATSTPNQ